MTPEGRVKNMVKMGLRALGVPVWRFMPVQTGFGSTALDFILCINGWFVSIETKKDAKSKLTPLQQSTKADMEAAGGIVLVVYDQTTCDNAMKIIHKITGIKNAEHLIYRDTQDAREEPQHEGTEQPSQAADPSARRHHGPPRSPPKRRAVKGAGGNDPAVTAAVIENFCTCQFGVDRDGVRTIYICPRCSAIPMTNGD